jgi:hypothetical protein
MKPLDLLEEALQILRSGGSGVLLVYWTGALPFGMALLWLLRDAGFRWGGELMLRDSLICAAAFVWMSYWKSAASGMIFSLLAPDTRTADVCDAAGSGVDCGVAGGVVIFSHAGAGDGVCEAGVFGGGDGLSEKRGSVSDGGGVCGDYFPEHPGSTGDSAEPVAHADGV